MSGMGLVFNIAKDALIAQRYSIDVTAHNIANVDTPGYSRHRENNLIFQEASVNLMLSPWSQWL